jgi:23S rRNA (adenine1618-N6)-methyltransferase
MVTSSGQRVISGAGKPHPRNQHRDRYDFDQLIRQNPEFAEFVVPHPCGGETIDFNNPAAVKALNRALLRTYYKFPNWDIPAGYLCPPIPSRADYIHHVADLLSDDDAARIPRGRGVRILDIGTGANCVYPIIGTAEYGWSFVGTDIDLTALRWSSHLVTSNPSLNAHVEIRRQFDTRAIFEGVVEKEERFDATLCNPPFHASANEAAAGTRRKLDNLGHTGKSLTLNFGGQSTELWCEGGEAEFVRRMIFESAQRKQQIRWFTTLVSKRGSLPAIYHQLKRVDAAEVRTIPMGQGQKQSRIVAWSFFRA